MHDAEPGERLKIDIAAMRHRRVGEEHHRVKVAGRHQGAKLLVAAAPALGRAPTTGAVVTGLAARSAYMMPVGTAANALVYGTGAVTTRDMIRAGFVLNVASVGLITLVGVWLLPLVLP